MRLNRFTLVIPAIFCGTALAQSTANSLALATPVLSYPNAITNQNTYPKPPLPASGPGSPGFGPAGTVYQDPIFGSRILRVTDPNTAQGASSYVTNSAAYQNSWAPDDSAFLVTDIDNGGYILFGFQPSTFTVTNLGYVGLSGAIFSFQNPHLIYGIGGSNGRTIESYDYTTGIYTPILDLNKVFSFQQYVGALSISANDNNLAVAFGGQQNTMPYVLVYQRSTHTGHFLNLASSKLDGQPTSTPLFVGVHSLQMDMSGRYVELALSNDPQAIYGIFDWDTATGTITAVTNSDSGHIALGYGMRINQSGISTGLFSDSRSFILRPLTSPNGSGTLQQLVVPPPPYSWVEDGHWSWVNARSGMNVPFCGTFYSQYTPSAWGAYYDEIDCVATDGSNTVWRMGQTRSINNGNFYAQAVGNVSLDGKYFIYESNWEQSLGNSGQRIDVFLVDFTSAHNAAAVHH